MPAKVETGLKSWQIFALVLLANVCLAWLQDNLILTREAYHSLLADQMEESRIEAYFDLRRSMSTLGYLVSPLLFWLQIAFLTLLVQAPLLLLLVEIPFGRLFRVLTLASVSGTLQSLAQLLRLSSYDAGEITMGLLASVPLSLGGVMDAAGASRPWQFVLGKFNVFEALWCVLVFRGLAGTSAIKKDTAAVLVGVVWLVLLLVQWGLVAYFAGVAG